METEPEHIEELKAHCEELWGELRKRHEDVKRHRPVRPVTRDDAHLEIYRERERKLIAEVQILEGKRPSALPTDRDAQREVLINELTTSIAQLQETLSVLTSEKKKMVDDIQRETELTKQLEAINAKLQEKLEDTPTEVKISQKRYLQELKEKETEASKQQRSLMKQMANFLSEHFPLPTQHDVDQVKKRPNTRLKSDGTLSRVEVPVSELLPLQSILEMLMNKCLDTPHDAYVMVDERFWQPYITVLLRCNIALRHPEDDRRIKLVPFHL